MPKDNIKLKVMLNTEFYITIEDLLAFNPAMDINNIEDIKSTAEDYFWFDNTDLISLGDDMVNKIGDYLSYDIKLDTEETRKAENQRIEHNKKSFLIKEILWEFPTDEEALEFCRKELGDSLSSFTSMTHKQLLKIHKLVKK